MRTFLVDFYDKLYFFFTQDFAKELLIIKIVSWIFCFFLIFLVAALLRRSDAFWKVREALYARESAYPEKRLNRRWQKILKRLERGDQASLKLAVIEADNIIDEILKRMALPGNNFEERLRQFERHELSSVDLVWEAHRLRDFIVHAPDAQITQEQAEGALKYYETALKELEYLE